MITLIKEILLGFLVGLGKIIPGVSGSMIAISFGIYDKLINSVLKPFKNIKFILTIGIGFMLAIVFGSRIIVYFMNNYYFLTMIFFIGLISGGLPKIINKAYDKKFNIKYFFVSLIAFSFVILLSLFKRESYETSNINYLFLIVIGFIEACTMIIPGISGTAVLMIIGYYDIVMNFFNNILNISNISYTIKFAIPFLVGIVVGVYLLSKLINYLISKYERIFFAGIVGFSISSILIMFESAFIFSISLVTFIEALIFISLGFIISYKFDR